MKQILKHKLEVTMDDGTEYTVFADQRDLAAWEATDVTGGSHTAVRYWAWSCMKRNGQYAGTFQKFNEKDCMQVASVGDEEQAAEQGEGDSLDPTAPR